MSLETFNHDELLQEVKLILDGSHPTYKGKDGAGRFLRHVGRDFNSLEFSKDLDQHRDDYAKRSGLDTAQIEWIAQQVKAGSETPDRPRRRMR
ncbi:MULTISPECIES: hypothetical protein [Pseudomonas]|uniref:hypothetical protein n=1 Tax=Pseudomonas TaxID=286 RepID=UPI00155DB740|nr:MULTISPECIES: hypothetical protein [Pseudomonas]MBI6601805.1 hypothetical protein [Pseudomonas sp. S4_EA_1b]UZM96794.1 hypothetical protein OPZ46_29540 [Pseudomonas putida DOT-T1E]